MNSPAKPSINWRELTFVKLAVSYILGLLLNAYYSWDLNLPIVLLLVIAACSIGLAFLSIPYAWRYWAGVPIIAFFFLLGIQNAYQHKVSHHDSFFYHQIEVDSPLIKLLVTESKASAKWTKVEGKVLSLEQGAKPEKVCGKLLAYLELDSTYLRIKKGDIIELKTKIGGTFVPKNPKAFDQANFLANKNIYHQSFIKKGFWQKVGEEPPLWIIAFANKARFRFLEVLKTYFPKNNERGVAEALILGYKQEMGAELKLAYSRTGAMHVLAVSGLHVGIVSGLLLLFFRLFLSGNRKHTRWIRTVLIVLLIWFFALLTGLAPSVMRASLMFSLLLIGKALNRDSDIYNILAASAVSLLLINPFLIKDVGFQLSYAAVIGIVYFQPKIYTLFFIEESWLDAIWKLTSVSLAAQLSTLPFALFYFHQFPVYFWLSGLVVVPLAGLILGLGLLLFFAALVLPSLAVLIAKVLFWLIWIMNALVFMIEKMPFGLIENIWLQPVEMLLLGIGLLSLVFAFYYYSKYWLYLFLFVLFGLAGTRFYYKKLASQQSEIVIYHQKKGLLIDVFKGRNVVSYRAGSLSERDVDYTAKNYRGYNLMNGIRAEVIEKEATQEVFDITWESKSIVCIDSSSKLDKIFAERQSIDYLVITDKPWLDFEKIAETTTIGRVLFTANNPSWLVKKWKIACAKWGIDTYDIKEEGAFIEAASK